MISFRKVYAVALASVLILAACGDDEKKFDADAAAAEVAANVVGLFDQLAIAGNEASSDADKAAAVTAAAGLIEGGNCPVILETVPTIAGLAAAAELTLVIDEPATFNEAEDEATYVFSALSFGAPSQLDHSNGISVLEDGVWKIAAEIWGAFVSMGGGTPPDAAAFSC